MTWAVGGGRRCTNTSVDGMGHDRETKEKIAENKPVNGLPVLCVSSVEKSMCNKVSGQTGDRTEVAKPYLMHEDPIQGRTAKVESMIGLRDGWPWRHHLNRTMPARLRRF